MTPVRKLRPLVNPRVLRDLQLREVSLVDRGAGVGTKVVLAKRDDDREDTTMPTTNTIDVRKAPAMWSEYCALVQKRDGLTASRAIDRALQDETGRELFSVAKMSPAGPAGARYDSYADNR